MSGNASVEIRPVSQAVEPARLMQLVIRGANGRFRSRRGDVMTLSYLLVLKLAGVVAAVLLAAVACSAARASSGKTSRGW